MNRKKKKTRDSGFKKISDISSTTMGKSRQFNPIPKRYKTKKKKKKKPFSINHFRTLMPSLFGLAKHKRIKILDRSTHNRYTICHSLRFFSKNYRGLFLLSIYHVNIQPRTNPFEFVFPLLSIFIYLRNFSL